METDKIKEWLSSAVEFSKFMQEKEVQDFLNQYGVGQEQQAALQIAFADTFTLLIKNMLIKAVKMEH